MSLHALSRLLFIAVVCGVSLLGGTLFAQEEISSSREVALSDIALAKDKIISFPDSRASLTLKKKATKKAVHVVVKRIGSFGDDTVRLTPPSDSEPLSDIYAYAVKGVQRADMTRPFELRIVSHASRAATISFFDYTQKKWRALPTKRDAKGAFVTQVYFSHLQFALFQKKHWRSGDVVHESLLPLNAVYVRDAQGTKLFAKNEERVVPIASLTKFMTALVFLDHRPAWNTLVRIKKSDDAESARLSVRPGDGISVKDLFYSTLVGSRNNAARALARSTGLSQESFIQAMNEKARALALADTHFVEVTGLDPANRSTARDIATLTDAAFDQPDIARALELPLYTFRLYGTKRRMTVRTTNPLVRNASFPILGKTGYIEESGYNFAAHVKGDRRDITLVLLGAHDSATRFAVAKEMSEFFGKNTVVASGERNKKE